MTQNESLCTIYYADGRQEGPISSLVVRDLVQAGVLSPQDRVAVPGEQPVSVAEHPLFTDLMRKGRSTGAVTAVKLGRRSGAEPSMSDRRARNAARLARLTQPAEGGARTLVTSGAQPAIQRSQQQAAIQRSQQQPAIQRSQQQPAIQRSRQQAAIQRGASPSRPVLRGLGSSSTNADGGGQGVVGSLEEMYASSNKSEFFEKAIARDPVHMRDKLLMASLPDILGVRPDAPQREMAEACAARDARLRERYKGFRGGDEYLALIDSLKITHLAYNTLTGAAERQAYEKACAERGRLVSFQNHLPVTLAMDPGESLPAMPADIARLAASAVSSPPQAQPTSSISTLNSMGSALGPGGGSGEARIGGAPAAGGARPAAPSFGGLRRMVAPSSLDSGAGSDMEDSTALMSATDLAMAMTNVQVEINKPPEDPADGLMLESSDEDEEVVFEAGGLVGSESGNAIVSEPTSDVEDIFKSLDGSKALQELPGAGDFAIDDMLKSLGGPAMSRPPAASPASSPPSLPQRPVSALSQEVAAAEPAPSPEFTIEELNQGAQALRDKLLMSSLPEILGVDFGVPSVAIAHTYELRRDQIRSEFPTTGFRLKEDDRLAAQDILNILESALEIMTHDEKRLEYQAASEARGRMLSFQNHVPFTFAFQEKEARKNAAVKAASQSGGAEGDGGRVSGQMSAIRGSGQMSAIRGSGQMSAIRGSLEMPAARASGEMPAARASGEMLAARVSGQMPAAKPPESVYRKMKEEEERKKKREIEARKKEERRKQFLGAEHREKGDPFKGRLVFSIGRADRGLKHVLPVYVTAFLFSFLMVSVGGMGVYELELRIGDPIIYARNGMLIVLALMGLMLLRRESVLRFGLFPKLLPTLISLPFIGLLAAAASVIARFDINPGATMESLAILLALRAVAEGLFFYGYVTRTLLIEFKQPAVAILLSAFLYGMYALTYATLIDAKPFQTFYAVLIYTFGGGVPLAAIYWQTRSSIVIIIAQFFILFMAAYGGLQYALIMN